MTDRVKIETDVEFVRYLKKHGGETMKKCYQCATCSVVCELSPQENAFPRKEMINAAWGMKEQLLNDPDIWLCHGCMDCSQQCPRSARPADLMAAIRNYIYREYAIPKFLGTWLNDIKYLPHVIALSVLVITALLFISHGGNVSNFFVMSTDQLKYSDMLPHIPLEVFFMSGNALIFTLAGMSFNNYWKDMNKTATAPAQMGFIVSAIEVTKDFMFHKKFDKCPTNSNKYYGHLYVFYGFVGLMIATFIVVLGEYGILPMPYPMDILHPVKVFGLVAGLFFVVGGMLLMIKRYQTEPKDGKNSYSDWFFIWTLWSVGVTGMLAVFARFTNEVFIAYPIYYVHLILIFMLLWFMPYTKFAHMIYRFLGLTFLKMHGRDNKPKIFKTEKIEVNSN